VLTLSLGIGVNVMLFSFLETVYLRPPVGVRDPTQLRRVWSRIEFRGGPQFWPGFSYPQYAAVKSALDQRATTAIYRYPEATTLRFGDQDVPVQVSRASASFFDLLGIQPRIGRFYTTDEDRIGAAANVAVISYGLWRDHLSGGDSVVGRTIVVQGQRYVLVGVAPERFTGVELDATDLWLPFATEPSRGPVPWWQSDRVNGFQILLRPTARAPESDVALEQRVAAGLHDRAISAGATTTPNVVRLGSIIRAQGPGDDQLELQIATRLAGLAIVVLLIACANVVNLLLARATYRRQEIAVRLAMGISRTRLMRLLVVECLLLTAAATVGATVIGYWGALFLRTLLLPDVSWGRGMSPVDLRVASVTILSALGAGLIVGVAPAVHFVKTDLVSILKGARYEARGRRTHANAALVVAQSALSVLSLVGAGLFLRSLNNLSRLRSGYDTAQVVYASVQFDTRDSARDTNLPQTLNAVAERVRATPGVRVVAFARMTPIRAVGMLSYYPDVDTARFHKPPAVYNLVSSDFFSATGIRILRGSVFPRTSEAGAPAVIVNDAMARAQWPGMEALGRCLRFAPGGPCYRVIGVAETALMTNLLEKPQPQFYLPLDNPPAEAGRYFSSLIVRAQPESRSIAVAELRRSLARSFPAGRISVGTMEELLEPQYRPWRLGATLFAAFGILALALASIGIYGVVAHTVARRRREFGLRSALGATRTDILLYVIWANLRTVGFGVCVGLALAVASGRIIAALLYGVGPRDTGVLVAAAAAMAAVAMVAGLEPAWRATRVDPVTALRAE
jgi:predicted permease